MPESKQASPTPKDGVETPPALPPTPSAEIKNNAALIERAVSTLEPRFTHRVLRGLTQLRKRLDTTVLKEATTALYPKGLGDI
jgi:26S proteasome regulatory subunit N3